MTDVNDKLHRLLVENRAVRDLQIETHFSNFYRLQLADYVLHLLLQTKEYQDKAVSYRSFNVGAGVLAVRTGMFGSNVGRFFGNNIKVDDTDTINIHAEDIATGKASEHGYEAISVLTVIGPTQEDHTSGLHANTLHPCGRCRRMLDTHPLMHPNTLIVTARDDFRVIDVSDLQGIKLLHEGGDASGVNTFELNDSEDLFTPIATLEARAPRVDEVDDSEWQQTVGAHLVQRYVAFHQKDPDE